MTSQHQRGPMSMYRTLNPASGELLREFAIADDEAVERALAISAVAFAAWKHSAFAKRRALLESVAIILDAEAEKHARTITEEMGKTLRSAEAEVRKCASTCRWYAAHAEVFLASERISTPAGDAEVRYQPLGTVLAVMPWNFPFWQAIRFLAPALMAGNAVLLKPAPSTPASALALQDILDRAGAPVGLFQNLFIDNEQVGRVIADPRVAAVTLTGSERAGEAVGSAAGAALKPAVLEIGGSDPLIVMPSADFDAAVGAAVLARHQNNGQSCVCAKRILVHQDIYGIGFQPPIWWREEIRLWSRTRQVGHAGICQHTHDSRRDIWALSHGQIRGRVPRGGVRAVDPR